MSLAVRLFQWATAPEVPTRTMRPTCPLHPVVRLEQKRLRQPDQTNLSAASFCCKGAGMEGADRESALAARRSSHKWRLTLSWSIYLWLRT